MQFSGCSAARSLHEGEWTPAGDPASLDAADFNREEGRALAVF